MCNDQCTIVVHQQLDALWREHASTAFPRGCGGEEVEGVDSALLDTEAAGCIQTLIHSGGHLDIWRTAVLGLCYRDLAVVTARLEGETREYFARLETLAGLALRSLMAEDKAKQDATDSSAH